MGSALKNQIVAIIGSKGGVGCSSLTTLISHITAKKWNFKVAVLDGTPFQQSMLFSYLSLPNPSHSLIQLKVYRDHLNSKLMEKYFISIDNITYIPITQSGDPIVQIDEIINLIPKVSSFFDFMLIDLSSFSYNQQLRILEISNNKIILASLDHASLISLKKIEKRLSEHHLDIKNFQLVLNQTHQNHTQPKDPQALSNHFQYLGFLPFLGNDLSISFLEKKQLQNNVEKSINPIVEAFLQTGSNKKTENFENSIPTITKESYKIPLHEIHELHQKLLENLRKSGILNDSQNGYAFQRDILEPQAKEILNNLIQEMKISNREIRQQIVAETLNLAFGLGPLEQLLQDPQITEIMVNGPHQVFVEKNGMLQLSDVRFFDDQQLRTAIERILSPSMP